ncbi:MAG: hypothetical protein H6Q74_1813 [Firmicutes bacterium]|nr:hypothetical protein [Bacillota bacterium]
MYNADQQYSFLDKQIVEPTLTIFDNPNSYGLQDRPGQGEMALDIAEAIRDRRNIMVEAGVGIGKSLGYLIPGILAAKTMQGPIIIATSSIALSEQLMKDARQAQAITGIRVNPVLAKGMSNYICRKRVIEQEMRIKSWKEHALEAEYFDERLLTVPEDVWDMAHLCQDRVSLPMQVTNMAWEFINVNRCTPYRCDFKDECGCHQMRQAIGNNGTANIIIANQDLYIANQINDFRTDNPFINTNKQLVIIDEAHNLETKTRSALTERWSKPKMLQILKSIQRPLARANASDLHFNLLSNSEVVIQKLFDSFKTKMATVVQNDRESREAVRYPIPETLKPQVLAKWAKNLEALVNVMLLATDRYGGSGMNAAFEDAINQFTKMQESIRIFAEYLNGQSNYLCWLEGNYKIAERIDICSAPKDIDRELQRLIFSDRKVPVVMTSATLCDQGKTLSNAYSYMKKTTGFFGEVYPPKPSPFPYDKNSMLYVAADIEDPSRNHETFLAQVADKIVKLVTVTNGRTLILFTSKNDLAAIYTAISKKKLPWKMHRQRDGGAQGTVAQEFIASGGILFSTGFWEGFNIPGSPLSSVIIVKLPFPVPDPIIDYKISIANHRLDVLVPEMLIKLRQGVGRLIRGDNDTGIVSILDSRASLQADKPYRDIIFNALPIKNTTESFEAISAFAKTKITIN